MKHTKSLSILILCIAIFSIIACCTGIFSTNLQSTKSNYQIHTFRNQLVTIQGSGLYKNDSVSAVSQGIAQDYVTLFLAIPLLLISYLFVRRNSLKGKLLLTGTVGYFLYTYTSYTFLWMFNPLFLIYVLLMSMSFFTFILLLLSIDRTNLKMSFQKKLPVRFLGGFQICFACLLIMMWLKRILPSTFSDSVPYGLEHYTTLVIQGMDLGFIVPAAFLSGILLIQKNEWGYLLTSVIIIKGVALSAAIVCMLIFQCLSGEVLPLEEVILFPLLCLFLCVCLYLLLKNIKPEFERSPS